MKTRDSGMPPESCWATFFNPSEILPTLGLHRAEGPVVDSGAGYATFAFAANRLTGQQVIALDVERSLLEDLARKVRGEHVHNVQAVLRDVALEGTGLPDGYADVVWCLTCCIASIRLTSGRRSGARCGPRDVLACYIGGAAASLGG